MKKLVQLSLLSYSLLIVFSVQGFCQTLKLSSYSVNPGDNIQVSFTALPNYSENAWIGIIPSQVKHGSEAENDKYDIAYQHIKKKIQGTMQFKAPLKPGSYDFRMHDTDNNGKEVASVSFLVKKKINGDFPQNNIPSLKLFQYYVNPGDNIQVNFTASSLYASNAWIGIVPSHINHGSEAENDKHELSYQYINKKLQGTMKFKAPLKPGSYDFRMHDTDTNGKEVTFVSFEVTKTNFNTTTVTPLNRVNFNSSWIVNEAKNRINRNQQTIIWEFSKNGTVRNEYFWRGLWERADNNKIRIISIDRLANTDEFEVTFYNNGKEFIATKNGHKYKYGKINRNNNRKNLNKENKK